MKAEFPLVISPRKEATRVTPPRADVTRLLGVVPELQIPERKGQNRWLDTIRTWRLLCVSGEERIEERLRLASLALKDCVEINARRLGGVPTLKGSRFSVGQVLSQIADGDSIDDLAENFDLDREQLATLLHAIAAYLSRPVYR